MDVPNTSRTRPVQPVSAPQIQDTSKRWPALVHLSLAQLMIALDATLVNVAAPSVQNKLGLADGDRH